MRKVRISADLEKRIRAGDSGALGEIVKLLDEDVKKRATGSGHPGVISTLGYKELVALFRSYLGHSLITPPRPNVGYIVKVVNKAKELGIDYTNVEQITIGLRRAGRPPYRLWDVVYNADRYYHSGDTDAGDSGQEVLPTQVHTGRPDGAED